MFRDGNRRRILRLDERLVVAETVGAVMVMLKVNCRSSSVPLSCSGANLNQSRTAPTIFRALRLAFGDVPCRVRQSSPLMP